MGPGCMYIPSHDLLVTFHSVSSFSVWSRDSPAGSTTMVYEEVQGHILPPSIQGVLVSSANSLTNVSRMTKWRVRLPLLVISTHWLFVHKSFPLDARTSSVLYLQVRRYFFFVYSSLLPFSFFSSAFYPWSWDISLHKSLIRLLCMVMLREGDPTFSFLFIQTLGFSPDDH